MSELGECLDQPDPQACCASSLCVITDHVLYMWDKGLRLMHNGVYKALYIKQKESNEL